LDSLLEPVLEPLSKSLLEFLLEPKSKFLSESLLESQLEPVLESLLEFLSEYLEEYLFDLVSESPLEPLPPSGRPSSILDSRFWIVDSPRRAREITNSKSQIPSKHQAPRTKSQYDRHLAEGALFRGQKADCFLMAKKRSNHAGK
jgi:hypothetical protein